MYCWSVLNVAVGLQTDCMPSSMVIAGSKLMYSELELENFVGMQSVLCSFMRNACVGETVFKVAQRLCSAGPSFLGS